MRRWLRFSLRDAFAAIALVALVCGTLYWLTCGPDKVRLAKQAGAIHEAQEAGIQVTSEELDAAGWQPGDDLATIRRKLNR